MIKRSIIWVFYYGFRVKIDNFYQKIGNTEKCVIDEIQKSQ